MDYRIWITYHKDEQIGEYGLREDEAHKLFASHKDVDGKNINSMNPVYSEMVTMWYVWKNNIKSDYVGFNHYRRRFAVDRLPSKGECQVFDIRNFGGQTVYEQYARWHNPADMDAMLGLLDSEYGEGNAYTRYIRESHVMIPNCCFLMKWMDFVKMCKFMFPLLEAFADKCGAKTVEDWRRKAERDFGNNRTEYQVRCLSFLAERLISAWITVNLTPYIGGRNVATVHYNTPRLLEAAIKSLMKHTPGCRVYVFDNSDKEPFTVKMPNVEVIDNTKGQLIDFDEELAKYQDKHENDTRRSNYGSTKHSMSVDMLMDMIPDGFVLMDSDVVIKDDIKAFWNRKVACLGAEEVKHNVPLLMPFLCWLNVPMLRDKGIRYFNGQKMWALSNREPDCWYDTGAWLLEEVRRNNLPTSFVDIWRYVDHYGHGSWRKREQAEQLWLAERSKYII